ncbi:hypothetical protein GCM10023339_49860 [Alloalcanivorax gelatiniphagus]
MEHIAAVADVHLEAFGDLFDVLVQAPTEAGQATGVVRFETDLLGSGWCVQVGKGGPAGC